MSEKLVKRILSKIDGLPAFSKVADKALVAERKKSREKGSNKNRGFHDPRLAKQILQITNLTSFGFAGHKAGSFESEAFPGEDILRGMMLAYPIQEFMDRELKAYEMAEGKLWEHSMNCGLSAWMVATKVDYSDLETAFVAGMMHDVGKVVLDEFLFEENQKFADMTKRQALTTAEAERAIFGIDHAEAGSRIAEKWNFSDKVVEAIKYHHQPEQAINEPDLTTIVYFADFVCASLGITTDMSIFMQNFEGPHLSSAG